MEDVKIIITGSRTGSAEYLIAINKEELLTLKMYLSRKEIKKRYKV